MSRFQFPFQGVDFTDGYSAGDIEVRQTYQILFSDTGVARTPIKLPRPYRISSIIIDTLTAFDAATATLALGVTGSTTRFASALNIKAAGRVLASSDATKLVNFRDLTDGSVFDIISTLTAVGGTAGLAEVTFSYTCPRIRND